MSDDNIIDLELRRNPIKSSQAKLLARLKREREAKQSPRIQAERLIWAREMFKFSQEDWAEILEVTLETVQEWEEGKSEPNAEQFRVVLHGCLQALMVLRAHSRGLAGAR